MGVHLLVIYPGVVWLNLEVESFLVFRETIKLISNVFAQVYTSQQQRRNVPLALHAGQDVLSLEF